MWGPSGASHCGHFLWQSAAVVFEGEWVWMCACGRQLMQECEGSPGVVGVTSDEGQGSQMGPAL